MMRQNRPLLAVLTAGVALALGVVAFVSLRTSEPAPEDIAIRVGTVEATFGELELWRLAIEATQPVHDRLLAGEDFGMPPPFVEQQRLMRALMEPVQADTDPEVALIAWVVSGAAARDMAERNGGLSEEEIATRLSWARQADEVVRTSTDPLVRFSRAIRDAQRAALGDDRYEDEYVPMEAIDGLARQRLTRDLELSPSEAGVLPILVSMRVAEAAAISLHESLDVTVEEVRRVLAHEVAVQEAMLALAEEFQADFD